MIEAVRTEQVASISNQIIILKVKGRGGSHVYFDVELRALFIAEKVDLYRRKLKRKEKVMAESEASDRKGRGINFECGR